MKNPNIKLIAVVPNISGGCKYVGLVKNVTNEEYATLLKEQREQEQKENKEKKEIFDRLQECEEIISKLEHEIKVLKGEEDNEQVEESIND